MRIALLSLATVVPFSACVAPATPGTMRQGPDPVSMRYINPGTLAALPGFTHAVRIGSTLYVSGEVALDSAGRLVGPGDLGAQAVQAFANLATVLRIGGATPADVAKLTIYVMNYSPRTLDVIRQAAPDFFPQRNPPAGIVVGVQSLPQEGLLIAVDATAVVRAMILPRDQRLEERRR
jgi:enamine deaminase RidA (YjgF/YER057c/UK114 family)